MFYDFREFQDGTEIETDICIIGAGAAGITLGRQFIGSRIRVCLLEGGGFEFDSATGSLYEGQNIGIPYFGLAACRLRYFGGTTNHWAGWCTPLNDTDFEARHWLPYSGWPIRKADVDPYYPGAQELCQLSPYRYDVSAWSGNDRRFPAFHRDKLVIRFWQFSPPTRFGEVYRSELEKAQNVHVYLYANATELEANESASEVRRVRISTMEHKTGAVTAKYFILACGGIENARLLLVSNKMNRTGLGNRYGMVGRFFMEHPRVPTAVVLPTDLSVLIAGFTEFTKANQAMRAGICPTPAAQERNQILNCITLVFAQGEFRSGFDASRQIKWALAQRKRPDELAKSLWTVITDLDGGAGGLYNRTEGKSHRRPLKPMSLLTVPEQAPNPDSRVTLSDERDQLGLRKVKLDWRLTEMDRRTVQVTTRLIGEEFGRLGLGRIQLAHWLTEDNGTWPEEFEGSNHHMGTTRMAGDPKQGVVDRDCRVHGIGNLYVAGSSVFSTAGYANPTLSIVALVLRLADHLKGRLSG